MSRPQFSAKFKPGVKYLRHTNGIVYPYLAALAEDPNYKVVVFKNEVHIQEKPMGYIPPKPEEQAEEIKKPAEIERISDLAGSINRELLNPPLPDGAIRPSVEASKLAAEMLSGLDVGE